MISRNLPKQLFFIFLFIYSLSVSAQSISGNASSAISTRNLGFATVNIYKNGKLVANILTDEKGDFNIKLDTGLYKCEIVYAGFEKISKEIKVTKDEKADFSLDKDKKSKYSATTTDVAYKAYTGRGKSSSRTKGITTTYMWGYKKNDSGTYGKLTAGEINDFSKWNLWTDLRKGELKNMQSLWKFAPTDRYTLQLKDQNDLPLANAKVELLNGKEVIYTAKSDNTGKAELWGSLKYDALNEIHATSIKVNYNGLSKTIKNIKKFEKGINTLVLNTECKQSQNVDIAIVVDATGSMQDEIDYLKFDLNRVIYQSKEFSTTLNLRFANIFYRDHRDQYLTQTQDFTSVLSESIAYTNEHNAAGGGDGPEAVEIALDSAINNLSWRENTRTKIIFLVLDAPPHNTPEIQGKMRRLAYQAAKKGIRIVPITGSSSNKENEYLMRCLALATNGTYTFLTNHSSIGNSHIEPSTDNYKVEILNDLLVRIIKSYTYMPDCNQYIADLGVNLPDSQMFIYDKIETIISDTSKLNSIKTNDNLQDSLNLKWNFYPNPTNGILNIVSNKAIKELYITDLSGKVLQIIRNIEADVVAKADLSNYSKGIYLIRYPIGKKWVSGKIILIR